MSTIEDRRYHDHAAEDRAARDDGIAALAEMILRDAAPIYIQHEFDDRLLADIGGQLRKALMAFDGPTTHAQGIIEIRHLRRHIAAEVARERYDCYLDMCREHADAPEEDDPWQ